MQIDFHYYATYCAAYIAGYSHEECMELCYSDMLVDFCTRTFLSRIKAPASATTVQSAAELADARTDIVGLQNITRIWASFHFLPYDLYAEKEHCSKSYINKYRMICNTNSDLLVDTVNLANGKSLQAKGIAMHVLSDTWAHKYFAGTPSLVINNVSKYIYELLPTDDGEIEKGIKFIHRPGALDDFDESKYINSIYQGSEDSAMNLGHARAGHLPDYSYAKYKYMPAWGDFEVVIKDNPSDYMKAFTQMIYALRFYKGDYPVFEKEKYDDEIIEPYREKIDAIFRVRRALDSDDWKAFGESLSGEEIEDFNINKYCDEYINASPEDKDNTFLGKFIIAALAQKSMVINKIYKSGNKLAGYSVDFGEVGFKGIKDYGKLLKESKKE